MANANGSTLQRAGDVSPDDGKPYSEIRDYVAQLEAQTDRLNTIMQNLRSRLDPPDLRVDWFFPEVIH